MKEGDKVLDPRHVEAVLERILDNGKVTLSYENGRVRSVAWYKLEDLKPDDGSGMSWSEHEQLSRQYGLGNKYTEYKRDPKGMLWADPH